MKEIIFITGGQRSGKSSQGQRLALERSDRPLYLATARQWDDDFNKRIARHRSDRGEGWETIEEEKNIGSLNLEGKTVLLDCVTLWLTNIFHDTGYDLERSLDLAKAEWKKLTSGDFRLIVISNEVGMGVIPDNEISRKFADLQGWMNQHIAAMASTVIFMVSGIPHVIKS
ncbi:MAG: bifunctional adenosylcobinamide kinase/adenosylcobinamide-phosphate guanylyltransferase [Bacteroidota bacterium]